MSEELHQCQRRVEIINLKLQRESEDVAAATAHLETKVKVPPSRAEGHSFIRSCRREVKKCQWFVDDVWSLQKMQELTANLERTEREHGRTLIKLEEERKLKRDHLKAAQVRQANLRARSS